MHISGSAAQRELRLRQLHDVAYADLLRFARRRVDHARADDVVAEVMLVAWRRLDDVPPAVDDARAWLFGVARNVMLNEGRRSRRQDAVAVRLAQAGHGAPALPHDVVERRIDLAAAWERLAAVHREALSLAVIDGLAAPQAAAVLGITPVAFRLRLSRARRALRGLLDDAPVRPDRPSTRSSR